MFVYASVTDLGFPTGGAPNPIERGANVQGGDFMGQNAYQNQNIQTCRTGGPENQMDNEMHCYCCLCHCCQSGKISL